MAKENDFFHITEADNYLNESLEVGKYQLASHLWTKLGNTKLAVTGHGYMNSCGYLKNLHQKLLARGYDVYCVDLPGHGKSDGIRYDIDNFETLLNLVETTIQTIPTGYQSKVFIAHSTGANGMIQYLQKYQAHNFDKIIFLAPLVRSYLYQLSRWGYRLGGRILRKLPRRPTKNVLPEFYELLNTDPFYQNWVPSHFARQLFNWNARKTYEPIQNLNNLHVLWAGQDTVIDTKYNKWYLSKVFPGINQYEIPESNHMFFYNNLAVREKFYIILDKILK